MSRKGNCYDNAFIESFWSSLKYELVYHHRFATRAEARTAIFDYIETFYNRTRLHSSLAYHSPITFESKLNQITPSSLSEEINASPLDPATNRLARCAVFPAQIQILISPVETDKAVSPERPIKRILSYVCLK